MPYQLIPILIQKTTATAPRKAPIESQRGKAEETALHKIERVVIIAARDAGVSAFWIYYRCLRQMRQNDLRAGGMAPLAEAIHSINVIVCVVVPALETGHLKAWGRRAWTLPQSCILSKDRRFYVRVPRSRDSRLGVGRDSVDRSSVARLERRRGKLVDYYTSTLQLSILQFV